MTGFPSALASALAEAPWCGKLATPFAVLGIRTNGTALTHLEYLARDTPEQAPVDAIAEETLRQLARYLEDPAFAFTLPLAPRGSAFRLRVWEALLAIPAGRSRTYGEIASSLASAPRAVGGACGANPIALVIPCHRVLGRDGRLGGFMNAAQGEPIAIKRWLLQHEGCRFRD